MKAPPAVVRMTDRDVERVMPVLARAFDEDPLFVWIEPDGERRAAFLAGFMRALAWRSHLYAEAYTTAGENVTFYQRFGFEVLHSGDLPGGGPPFWTMRRPPDGGATLPRS